MPGKNNREVGTPSPKAYAVKRPPVYDPKRTSPWWNRVRDFTDSRRYSIHSTGTPQRK